MRTPEVVRAVPTPHGASRKWQFHRNGKIPVLPVGAFRPPAECARGADDGPCRRRGSAHASTARSPLRPAPPTTIRRPAPAPARTLARRAVVRPPHGVPARRDRAGDGRRAPRRPCSPSTPSAPTRSRCTWRRRRVNWRRCSRSWTRSTPCGPRSTRPRSARSAAPRSACSARRRPARRSPTPASALSEPEGHQPRRHRRPGRRRGRPVSARPGGPGAAHRRRDRPAPVPGGGRPVHRPGPVRRGGRRIRPDLLHHVPVAFALLIRAAVGGARWLARA